MLNRFPITRGQLYLCTLITGILLLYITTVDTVIRPLPTLVNMEDFIEAEQGIGQPSSNSSSNGPSILIVSAMFSLEKARHSQANCHALLERFLGQVTTDVYMYTSPELSDFIHHVRGGLPITVDTRYSSPFEVPPLRDLEETYTRMNKMDKEKWNHFPGLYAAWNSKPYLLSAAVKTAKQNGKLYDYAFWNDGDSFRHDHFYTDWPNGSRVDQVWEEGSNLTGTPKEDLLFFPVLQPLASRFKNWREIMGPISNPGQFSEGSFFGGSPSAIEWLYKVFYAYHSNYLARGFFVGIDQDIYNAILLLFPRRFFTIGKKNHRSPTYNHILSSLSLLGMDQGFIRDECGTEWFYYQFWLADQRTRNEMRKMWTYEERRGSAGWWHERKLCRLTGGISMLGFLRTSLGDNWNPPVSRIYVPGLE